ncbi:MAG: hydrogenase iron-sulfur subunit [Anaerolineales bacterium]|nr:hydrogenase iron-sulfur subunit [Anaerolineales bacterium]
MKKEKKNSKIILFTCNWNAYSGLEAAGAEKVFYSPNIYPIRLACLGGITPGIILKAFENGASGVLLLGCSDGECQYETGNKLVADVFQESKNLLNLLGYNDNQFQLDYIDAGDGKSFKEIIQNFSKGIEEVYEN